jgi:hypothetical protein
MHREYKVADIRQALDAFEKSFPGKPLALSELEKIIKKFKIPIIYSIEDLIRLLSSYITENRIQTTQLYKESEVCRILKVRKLAMHEWRAKKYITCIQLERRTIRYDLNDLLKELKEIRDKNISLGHFCQ